MTDTTAPTGKQTELRVGLVGGGYFARFHMDAWSRIPGVRFAALADPDETKRAWAEATYPGIATYSSLAAMRDAGVMDLIDIATPPQTHAALVTEAMSTGLPVICQKPFCTTLAEAEAVTARAEAAGTLLVVHENFRFEPWYQECRRILDEGRLGEIYQISFRMRPGDGQGPRAYLDRQPYFQKMQRFLIRETGIHFIDVFRYLLGPVSAVTAHLSRLNPVIAGEDAGIVVFEFASGARGLYDANRLSDHISDNRRRTMGEMLLEGSKASLRLDGYGHLYMRAFGSNDETRIDFPWRDLGYGGDCVRLCLAHIADAVRAGTRPMNTAREYLENLRIEDAIYRSSSAGATMRLDDK